MVRLTLDVNYDRLEHISNYDSLVRELLGITRYRIDKEKQYSLTSLKENIRYIDEEQPLYINIYKGMVSIGFVNTAIGNIKNCFTS